MKLNKYFMLGLAGLAFAACSNEDGLPGNGDDGESKTLVIAITGINGGSMTKATTPEDKWTEDNDETGAISNITKIGLLFTDNNGQILYKYSLDKKTDGSEDAKNWSALVGESAKGLRFIGLTGVTQVHAIANTDITNWKAKNTDNGTGDNVYEKTNTFGTDLTLGITKNGGKVVYVGNDKTITPYQPEPAPGVDQEVTLPGAGEKGNFYYSADIQLVPIMSRIQITSINIQTSGSVTFGPASDEDKYTLTWSNFKPTLHGVYLNNFAKTYTLFEGASSDWMNNDSYLNNIAGGKWLVGANNADFTDDAAYVSYASNAYTQLLPYGTTTGNNTPLTLGDGKCIGFNIFVPFDTESYNATPGNTASADNKNPTIHFQFDGTVADGNNNYDYKITLTDDADATLTAEDQEFINSSEIAISYNLPTVTDEGFLVANISKLYKDTNETELVLNPGKIYNMAVTISPANMTVDLDNPTTTNVVVNITVLPFDEETIYPGFE